MWARKIDALDANESQFYEFQTNVNASVQVPTDKAERLRDMAYLRRVVEPARARVEKGYLDHREIALAMRELEPA